MQKMQAAIAHETTALYYKFMQYRSKRSVENETALKCTDKHANRFRCFEDMDK